MTLSTAQGWLAAVWGKAREAAGNMGKRTDVCPYKKANGQSDRRQKTEDGRTDRQTDRQTDRPAETERRALIISQSAQVWRTITVAFTQRLKRLV